MELSPDATIYWQWGPIILNATLVYTWVVMGVLTMGSWLITRNLSTEPEMSRWQGALETIVTTIQSQIRDIAQQDSTPYLPFIGTLFLFISVSNLLGIVPFLGSPTGSLSATTALALCVFFAVPVYGISQEGLVNYLKHYVEPTPIMAPFHIISEVSRTLALAVRLFGNVMSGGLIVAILLSIVPLFLPAVLNALELLIGQIQAYIFAVLAMVYIASGISARGEQGQENR
ncbi:MAG: F0F1 ATP synthase subunit A [Anaerolineae bacterium]|nr:F0F1 ATP synthase subunit A [Anaerolineae bacterium]